MLPADTLYPAWLSRWVVRDEVVDLAAL